MKKTEETFQDKYKNQMSLIGRDGMTSILNNRINPVVVQEQRKIIKQEPKIIQEAPENEKHDKLNDFRRNKGKNPIKDKQTNKRNITVEAGRNIIKAPDKKINFVNKKNNFTGNEYNIDIGNEIEIGDLKNIKKEYNTPKRNNKIQLKENVNKRDRDQEKSPTNLKDSYNSVNENEHNINNNINNKQRNILNKVNNTNNDIKINKDKKNINNLDNINHSNHNNTSDHIQYRRDKATNNKEIINKNKYDSPKKVVNRSYTHNDATSNKNNINNKSNNINNNNNNKNINRNSPNNNDNVNQRKGNSPNNDYYNITEDDNYESYLKRKNGINNNNNNNSIINNNPQRRFITNDYLNNNHYDNLSSPALPKIENNYYRELYDQNENVKQLKNNNYNFLYKPYTLNDYKKIADKKIGLGGLGPNIGTDDWNKRHEKSQRVSEYEKQINKMNKEILRKNSKSPEELVELSMSNRIQNSKRFKSDIYSKNLKGPYVKGNDSMTNNNSHIQSNNSNIRNNNNNNSHIEQYNNYHSSPLDEHAVTFSEKRQKGVSNTGNTDYSSNTGYTGNTGYKGNIANTASVNTGSSNNFTFKVISNDNNTYNTYKNNYNHNYNDNANANTNSNTNENPYEQFYR